MNLNDPSVISTLLYCVNNMKRDEATRKLEEVKKIDDTHQVVKLIMDIIAKKQ